MAHAYAASGDVRKARQILSEFQKKTRDLAYVPHRGFAIIYVGLGEYDAAVAELEKGDQAGEAMDHINVEPRFQPLRSNARFVALLRRHGFAS